MPLNGIPWLQVDNDRIDHILEKYMLVANNSNCITITIEYK